MVRILKSFVVTLLPISLVIVSDIFTKDWAIKLLGSKTLGFIKFKLVYNNGIILGSFSELPLNVKEIGLLTFGAMIVAFYCIGLWLIPIRSRAIYLGSSLIFGGIMGNLIDRLRDFSVVDFISIASDNQYPYFNVADIAQIIGHILLIAGLYKDSLYYWPKNDWRIKFLIKPKFQLKAASFISLTIFFSGIIFLTFSYAFFKSATPENLHIPYLILGLVVTSILSALSFIFSVFLTHRIAGPIHAIERQMKLYIAGTKMKLKLRENDEFKELEETFNLLYEAQTSENEEENSSKENAA